MGANAINLGELEAELSRTRAAFEAWSAGVLASAQECKASHLATMRAHKGARAQRSSSSAAALAAHALPGGLCPCAGELTALNERYQRAEKQAAAVRQRES